MKNFISRTILTFITIYTWITFCQAQMQVPENMKEQVAILHNTCRDETQVKEELIQQSMKGNLPDDKNLACYINCIFGKLGLINGNGELQIEHILGMLPPDHQAMLRKMTKNCGVMHGKDSCETAWLTLQCFFESDPENSMLI